MLYSIILHCYVEILVSLKPKLTYLFMFVDMFEKTNICIESNTSSYWYRVFFTPLLWLQLYGFIAGDMYFKSRNLYLLSFLLEYA
jgi:hypothetical protein